MLWLQANPFPCHKTLPGTERFCEKCGEYEDMCECRGPVDHQPEEPEQEGCAGAAIYLNNSVAISRDPQMREHQDKLKDVPDEVQQSVFTWSLDFLGHHKRQDRSSTNADVSTDRR